MEPRLTVTALARPAVSDNAFKQHAVAILAPPGSPPYPSPSRLGWPVYQSGLLRSPTAVGDRLLNLFWRQRILILICALLGVAAAAIYLHLATPKWTTQARIIMARSALGGEGSQSPALGDNLLNTQCDLIKSAPILALGISDISASDLQLFHGVHNRISFLKRALVVKVASQSDVIDLEMQTPFPDDAKKVVDSVVTAYQDFQRRQRLSSGGQMIAQMQSQRDQLATQLDADNRQLDALVHAHRVIGAGDQSSGIAMQRLSTLTGALTTAQLDTLSAKSTYEQAARNAGIDTSAPDWIVKNEADISQSNLTASSANEDEIRARLFDLQQQMSTLRRQYLPQHPSVQALQSHIDELSRALVAASRAKWLSAQGREKDLQETVDREQKIVADQENGAADVARLSTEVRRLQDASDSSDKRIRDLSAASPGAAFNIQMIEEAASSDEPTSPSPILAFPSFILGGVLVGTMLGLVREKSGLSINLKSVAGSGGKTMIGLPVFVSVPRQGEVSIKHVAWSAHLRPESTIAIAFKTLRDALQAASAGESGLTTARTILIASPNNGEGRSMSASNLAITLAKSGKSVCLVDADLRQPSLGKVFSVRETAGLSTVLGGTDQLTSAVQRTVIERLDLLPAGPSVSDPAELLNSPALAETLEDLTMKYDHVVIDSPPVLAAEDSRIIAASCDATLLLLSGDGASKRVAEQCRTALEGVGARILGILLNSAPKRGQQSRDGHDDRNRPTTRKPALPGPHRPDVPQLPHGSRA